MRTATEQADWRHREGNVDTIQINRAPVLTLWATVVAEEMGFDTGEALTLGKAVAGITAHSKAAYLGMIEPTPAAVKQARREREHEAGCFAISLLGRGVQAVNTPEGIRATDKSQQAIDPRSVQKYLLSKFGAALAPVREAMQELAQSRGHDRLAAEGWRLYEKFRPVVPRGEAGWAAKGELSLDRIRQLTRNAGS